MTAKSYDIAIVGGGLVGGALAYGLACAGHRVVMLDEDDHGLRAARGNFGLVWVQGKGADFAPYARWTRASARRWPELASNLREDTGIDVALSQPGGLHLCLSEREREARARLVAHIDSSNAAARVEMLDRGALTDMLPGVGPGVAGASYCRDDGQVDPLRLLRSLHAGFVRHGGTLLAGAAVRTLASTRSAFSLTTAAGPVHAARVVLAAGLGNAALAPQVGLSVSLRPQRGQIVALQRMPRLLPLPVETMRQTEQGTVLLGDSHEAVASTETSIGVLSTIAARALRAMPALDSAQVVRCWAALRVLTPDGYPIYEQSKTAPGAFLANCHSGVTLAAVHALALAPQIAAGTLDESLEPFAADRFDGIAA
jgi:glycine/D-amino acid oxidase-like deaminating enzyme